MTKCGICGTETTAPFHTCKIPDDKVAKNIRNSALEEAARVVLEGECNDCQHKGCETCLVPIAESIRKLKS